MIHGGIKGNSVSGPWLGAEALLNASDGIDLISRKVGPKLERC